LPEFGLVRVLFLETADTRRVLLMDGDNATWAGFSTGDDWYQLRTGSYEFALEGNTPEEPGADFTPARVVAELGRDQRLIVRFTKTA
jgi:hypothetical protein